MKWLYVFVILLKMSLTKEEKEEVECMFSVLYSNGSRSWCIDEQCSNHIDIISIEDRQCRTNYLSLKFSSYKNYNEFIYFHSLRIPIASFFSLKRTNHERLLQIEFLSPLDDCQLFDLNHLKYLSGPISNIDTLELIFNGNICQINSILYFDKQLFSNEEQRFIDTFRLIFNCSNQQRVEWELIKSIDFYPQSPCQQQIQFLNQNSTIYSQNHCFHWNLIISTIAFVSLLIFLVIILLLWISQMNIRRKQISECQSQIELIESINKF